MYAKLPNSGGVIEVGQIHSDAMKKDIIQKVKAQGLHVTEKDGNLIVSAKDYFFGKLA